MVTDVLDEGPTSPPVRESAVPIGVGEGEFLEALRDGGLVGGWEHDRHVDGDRLGERDPAQVGR
jgi:hypothetical protein